MINCALGIPFGDIPTLVTLALSKSDSDQKLRSTTNEVDLQGNQRGALGTDLSGKLHDLALVCKQLSNSGWCVLAMLTRGRVFADVNSVKCQRSRILLGTHPAFGETHLRITD